MAERSTSRAPRRILRPALGALVLLGLVATLTGAAGGAGTPRADAHGPIVKTAHAPLANCSASDVVISVTLSQHSYRRGQPVKVMVRAHNIGTTTCRYSEGPNVNPGLHSSTAATQVVGPCGTVGMAVYNASGAEVWPGPVAYSCPLLVIGSLGPNQTVHAKGAWDQESYKNEGDGSPTLVPRGRYRVVIDAEDLDQLRPRLTLMAQQRPCPRSGGG